MEKKWLLKNLLIIIDYHLWYTEIGGGNKWLNTDSVLDMLFLFLSGENIKENLELSDMEVYWGIMGQVMNQIL